MNKSLEFCQFNSDEWGVRTPGRSKLSKPSSSAVNFEVEFVNRRTYADRWRDLLGAIMALVLSLDATQGSDNIIPQQTYVTINM